jgi:hypothetical protein
MPGSSELDFRKPGECELAFLGLAPGVIGRGLGTRACRGGHPPGLRTPDLAIVAAHLHARPSGRRQVLSLRRFVPYRRALEVADDPRLTGRLPRDAAPDVPIV